MEEKEKELKSLIESYPALMKSLEEDLKQVLKVQDFSKNMKDLEILKQYYSLRAKLRSKAK